MCSPVKRRTHTRPSIWWKRKRDSSDQVTFFHCSVSSSDAHVPIVGTIGSGQGSAGAPWLVCGYTCSPICNKLWCTVYSDTYQSEQALTSSAIWAILAHLWDRTTQASLCSLCASWSPKTMSQVHHCYLLGALLIDTDHCRPRTSHKNCCFREMIRSSSYHLALGKLAQILMLAHYYCF